MTTQIAIMRSAQSVLHRTSLPREEADRIGMQIANCLLQPGNFDKAAARYSTTNEFEIGERAAREYMSLLRAQ
jgi:hypothetical protein